MNAYQLFAYPLLRQIDPEVTHEKTLSALAFTQETATGCQLLRRIRGSVTEQPVQALGLTFPNVIGIAAGFDKDVRVARGLGELGFGHIEVGTLTPRPQIGNPKPRIFRLKKDGAIINRMGFPNGGVDEALPRLDKLAEQSAASGRNWVLGVSLGKQKETALDDAVNDYVEVMGKVYRYADYLAVNISSPNTPGLRKLQGRAYLDAMLNTLQEESERLAAQHGIGVKPLVLKIAPDLETGEIDEILQAALDSGIAGIVATNTTLSREGLRDKAKGEAGGMSGLPLRAKSTAVIRHITSQCALPVIGVGGVRSAEDVQDKLDAGAVLVQLYSSLVYEGPQLAGQILRGLA